MFLTMMVIGLVGLVMMALPALGGHHVPLLHGHGHGHGHAHALDPGVSHGAVAPVGATHGHATEMSATASATTTASASASATSRLVLAATTHGGRRFIPSPRAVFSVLALYGAFGNALVHAAHLTIVPAALIAIAPALLVERALIRPVWNLVFRFRADASSPLEELIFTEAHAVVAFRNGRGLIATVRDGRRVQLTARLCDKDAALPVSFGQRLRIEDVDARRERVTVSVLSSDPAANKATTA